MYTDIQEMADRPYKEGWITKQGGFFKSWHRRWLMVFPGRAYYFAEKPAREGDLKTGLKGVIELEDAQVVRGDKYGSDHVQVMCGRLGKFRVFEIRVSDAADVDDWIAALKQGCAKAPSVESPVPDSQPVRISDLQPPASAAAASSTEKPGATLQQEPAAASDSPPKQVFPAKAVPQIDTTVPEPGEAATAAAAVPQTAAAPLEPGEPPVQAEPTYFDTPTGAAMIQELASNSLGLTEVHLRGTQLSVAAMQRLTQACTGNTCVRVLNLEDTGLTADHCPHLSRFLRQCSSLTALNISRNPEIGSAGHALLFPALVSALTRLIELSLYDTNLTPEGWAESATTEWTYMDTKATLKRLYIGGTL